ncbi:hypothetical protein [Halioxenophilus aromaticivorans]
MNKLRSTHWAKRALTVMMLCALLLQVQSVFACQMMDHSGPIEHCCCDEESSSMAVAEHQNSAMQCCDYGVEISMDVNIDEDHPVLLTSHSSLDPPPIAVFFILAALWPDFEQVSPAPVLWDLDSQPAHPGTDTWLSTFRLRI